MPISTSSLTRSTSSGKTLPPTPLKVSEKTPPTPGRTTRHPLKPLPLLVEISSGGVVSSANKHPSSSSSSGDVTEVNVIKFDSHSQSQLDQPHLRTSVHHTSIPHTFIPHATSSDRSASNPHMTDKDINFQSDSWSDGGEERDRFLLGEPRQAKPVPKPRLRAQIMATNSTREQPVSSLPSLALPTDVATSGKGKMSAVPATGRPLPKPRRMLSTPGSSFLNYVTSGASHITMTTGHATSSTNAPTIESKGQETTTGNNDEVAEYSNNAASNSLTSSAKVRPVPTLPKLLPPATRTRSLSSSSKDSGSKSMMLSTTAQESHSGSNSVTSEKLLSRKAKYSDWTDIRAKNQKTLEVLPKNSRSTTKARPLPLPKKKSQRFVSSPKLHKVPPNRGGLGKTSSLIIQTTLTFF